MYFTSEQVDLRVSPVRVLLVDDSEPFRRHVTSLMMKTPGFEIVGEAADGLEGIHKATELKPDLIVLDIGLPKLNGIEATRRMLSASPNSTIVVLTGEDSPQVARTALEAGARGYVIKVDAASELLDAIKTVLLGKKYIAERLAGTGLTADM